MIPRQMKESCFDKMVSERWGSMISSPSEPHYTFFWCESDPALWSGAVIAHVMADQFPRTPVSGDVIKLALGTPKLRVTSVYFEVDKFDVNTYIDVVCASENDRVVPDETEEDA